MLFRGKLFSSPIQKPCTTSSSRSVSFIIIFCLSKGPILRINTYTKRHLCSFSESMRLFCFKLKFKHFSWKIRNNRCLFGPGLLSSLGKFSISPLAVKLKFFPNERGRTQETEKDAQSCFFDHSHARNGCVSFS